MGTIYLRLLVVLGILWAGLDSLKATYEWYFTLTPEQKVLADTSKKDLQGLIKTVEEDASFVRKALGDPENYKIATSKHSQEKEIFALDVSPETRIYNTELTYNTLQKEISAQLNPPFRDFNGLKTSYIDLQQKTKELSSILDLQKMKNRVIKLGLDIAGGVHFSLSIDNDKMALLLDEQYKDLLNKDNIRAYILSKEPKLSSTELEKKINDREQFLLKEKRDKFQMQKSMGLDQALMKIRNRIDQFGVSEPVIIKGPNNTIVVELAGEKDIESAKEIFTRVGILGFQIVDEDTMKKIPLEQKTFNGYLSSEKEERAFISNNSVFLPVQGVDKFGQPMDEGYLSVLNHVDLSGDHIVNATVENDRLGTPMIGFRLDSIGADLFSNLTKKNVGKRLAIVLDGKIQSAPNIREAIVGGSGSISGSFTLKEANLLATILRSGSLPVPIQIEEERIIGPTLGQEEVHKGIMAIGLALLLVVVFMFAYYGLWGGLSTNLGQFMNILLILAIMAQLGATLTLPGLAAIVLTIGMSVDANIIIHERIKEDLKSGYNLPSALASGYKNAFTTILDSNITTFIPGLILGTIGNGPIRGFGITLMIGIIINMFTSVFCSRIIYDFLVERLHIKNIFWSRLWKKQ